MIKILSFILNMIIIYLTNYSYHHDYYLIIIIYSYHDDYYLIIYLFIVIINYLSITIYLLDRFVQPVFVQPVFVQLFSSNPFCPILLG